MGKEKIKTLDELKVICQTLRHKGKRIATTNGVYDILHPGHLKVFNKARRLGEVVIVGVNSDTSVKAYKGKWRPVVNQDDRALILSALEVIDYVTIFNEPDPRQFINIVKPAFHVKSSSGYKGIEGDAVNKWGGVVVTVQDLKGYSSTDIMDKITKTRYHEIGQEDFE